MKKTTLLFLAGGILTFAACTNEQGAAGGFTQEQVDSAVDARVAEIQAQLTASNDSAINALAQYKADSMIAAMKGTPAPARPKTTKPGGTVTTQAPAQPVTEAPSQPAATGKNSEAQKNGEATGKNSQAQKQNGEATGKRR